jgi:hypothetical protein
LRWAYGKEKITYAGYLFTAHVMAWPGLSCSVRKLKKQYVRSL